jgi:hypothetical protein
MSVTGFIVTVSVVAGAWWLLTRNRNRSGGQSAVDRQFMQGVLGDAASAIAQNGDSRDVEALRAALQELEGRRADPPILAPLLRLDYEVVKRTPSEVDLTVTVLLMVDGQARKVTSKSTVRWENLPNDIRAEFIRANVPSQAFTFFSREAPTASPSSRQ